MPLINFKTDLTSLRFGGDRPGGGSSNQPYMQFPIDNEQVSPAVRGYYEINRTALDFPVRGGAITQLLTAGSGIISSTLDRERIQKFFKDAPRGTAFIEKQLGLQLTNPRLQVPNALTFAGPSLGNTFLPVTNVYNPLNTLAQVQFQGTGAHFNRHGVGPAIYERLQQTYAFVAGAPQNNTEATNRLSILRALKLIGSTDFIINPSVVGGTGIDPTLADRLGISLVQNQLFNYLGGPGSVYGIGFTRISRYTDTNVTKLSETNPDPKFTVQGTPGVAYSTIALTYQQIANQGTNTRTRIDQPIRDFRNLLPTGTPRSDYSNFNIANPFNGTGGLGVGNPGASRVRARYVDVTNNGEDSLNMLNLLARGAQAPNQFFYNPSNNDPWKVAGDESKDIIKFAFECIDNDNLNFTTALIFRAFIEGQISDTNTGEYNSFKYLGRGETFRTYQGFDRTIGFGFKMFAQSRQEMLPMYTKLNQLISQVYPDYSEQYNLMRGNVVRLTIGDYIYRMPGFLENVNVTIDNSNTPWEIVLNQFGEEGDVRQLPHMVTVQCTFKPIMDILPRKVSKSNPFVPLIANKDHFIDPTATTIADRAKNTAENPNPIAPIVGALGTNSTPQVTTTNPPPQPVPRAPRQGGLGAQDFDLTNPLLIGG
jgi:hypothetical protein